MRTLRWASTLLVIGAGAIVLCATWLAVVHPPGDGRGWIFAGLSSVGLTIAALGVIITWKVPDNVVGVLLTWIGAVVAFVASRDVYYAIWRDDHAALPLSAQTVALLDESPWWLFVAAAMLFLLFPDGRLPTPRWWIVPPLLLGFGAAQHAYGAIAREPFGGGMEQLPRPWGPPSPQVYGLSTVVVFSGLGLMIACAVSLVVRFRKSSGAERAQLKWLSLVGLAATLYPLACAIEFVATGQTGVWSVVVGTGALVALPASVALAMLRHDLFDVDRVIADTISYVVSIVALVVAYATFALLLGLVVGHGSAPAAAAATAVCAIVFSPMRRWLQRVVDDRLSPPRRAALQAIEDLQRRVHTEDVQPEQLEGVLRSALRDPTLRVGLLVPGAAGFVDTDGAPVADATLVPVTLGGVQVGAITAGTTPFTVLRPVADAAASMVEVMRLRAQLATALRDVEASRSRLVLAGDAERRRLERDLHDGAQQRLVALGMSMRLAQRHLLDGRVDVDALLDQGVAEIGTAVAELRQIAHGLRPTSLDDGLHSALTALTNRLPIPVHLAVEPDPLAADVATTAYYVAAEAITNAAKHARATMIDVRVEQAEHDVRVCVHDDGCGGARAEDGSGLAGLADRVAATGGTFRLVSADGRGTTVEAVLPCG